MMQADLKQQVWSGRMKQQAMSGLGANAWCIREGLNEAKFYYWRRRLAVSAQPATSLIALPFVGRPVAQACFET